MINKVYDKVKEYIKKNKVFFVVIISLSLISFIEFPFYINAPGGLVNLDKKIIIDNEYKSKGTFNMAYVSEYRSNAIMLIYALINPHVDIYKKSDYLSPNDTDKTMIYREKLQMEEAVDNAIILAYQKANKEINITKIDLYVTYILEGADTNIEVGDLIKKVDNKVINNKEELNNIISNHSLNERFEVEVIHDDKTYIRYASKSIIEDLEIIGLTLSTSYEYNENPPIKFKYKKNEYGPSGGLMMALEIYNELISYDLTNGKKIAGTGTINIDGSVGSIGGVKYKLRGAVNKKADIFLVPEGENYEEAIKEKEKNNYKIEIVSIKSFDEAINYLKK